MSDRWFASFDASYEKAMEQRVLDPDIPKTGEGWWAHNEIKRLRRAMHDIYEVYAGSEGFPAPQTCSEAYLLERMMEMAAIAAEHKK